MKKKKQLMAKLKNLIYPYLIQTLLIEGILAPRTELVRPFP